jgi:hypothetical protein
MVELQAVWLEDMGPATFGTQFFGQALAFDPLPEEPLPDGSQLAGQGFLLGLVTGEHVAPGAQGWLAGITVHSPEGLHCFWHFCPAGHTPFGLTGEHVAPGAQVWLAGMILHSPAGVHSFWHFWPFGQVDGMSDVHLFPLAQG